MKCVCVSAYQYDNIPCRSWMGPLGGSGVLMSDSCDESLRSENDFDQNSVNQKNLINTGFGAPIFARTTLTNYNVCYINTSSKNGLS